MESLTGWCPFCGTEPIAQRLTSAIAAIPVISQNALMGLVVFRGAAAIALAILALLSALSSYFAYANLREGRAYIAMNAERFQAAGEYVMQYRALQNTFPDEAQIRHWAILQGYQDHHWAASISGDRVGGNSAACSHSQPEEGFIRPASDVFVLYRWRGEWFDCYSLPSGSNNVVHELNGEWPSYHVFWGAIAIGLLLAAWGVWPGSSGSRFFARR